MINWNHIVDEVAKEYCVERNKIFSPTRKKVIVEARMLSIWFCKKIFKYSLFDLGDIFDRDSTTIFHAVSTITKKLKTDQLLIRRYNDIRTKLHYKYDLKDLLL